MISFNPCKDTNTLSISFLAKKGNFSVPVSIKQQFAEIKVKEDKFTFLQKIKKLDNIR